MSRETTTRKEDLSSCHPLILSFIYKGVEQTLRDDKANENVGAGLVPAQSDHKGSPLRIFTGVRQRLRHSNQNENTHDELGTMQRGT